MSRRTARDHAVHQAGHHEHGTLSDVLARSFFDDPIMAWMVPNEAARYRKQLRFYRAELHGARVHGRILTTDDTAGVAVWMPPNRWRTDPRTIVRHLPALVTVFGTRTPKGMALLNELERQHPREPHWYLALLGTDPARQGVGVGGALIRQVTDEADAEGLGAYLESSKEANVPYYERFGFRVTRELRTEDSPTLWAMWRDPQ